MGSVIKRLVLVVALAALAAPAVGHASSTTEYGAPFTVGPAGGDANNTKSADAATGEVRVIRHQLAGVNGGLGCGGSGGWATLERTHTSEGAVTAVAVDYAEGVTTPFAFFKLSVLQRDELGVLQYLATKNVRGPGAGDGQIVLDEIDAAPGEITIRFGAEVSSACPGVEIARAVFQKVTVTEG